MEEFGLSDIVPTADLVGTVRAGCELVERLGEGAMGEVFLARRQADGARVVVKVMAAGLANDVVLRARFQREWEALQRVPPGPYVVRVHSVHETGERPSIVMEHVPGHALDALVKQRGRLSANVAARIARDVALGLVAVHGQGLIHRDVKPANVIVRPDGRACLVDFGLSKDLFRTALTAPGQMLGTANYMAPEQWEEGEQQDARCDVFSLGATLYHLVTGRAPFAAAREMVDIADMATSGDYPAPRELAPDVPPELELVIHQMLSPELRYRYPSAQACGVDLEGVFSGRPASVPCLLGAGLRVPLLPGRTFRIGTDARCEVRLQGAQARHAQVRRKAAGFVLQAIGGAPVQVGGQPLSGAHALRDGDQVWIGPVQLVFRDPTGAA